MILLRDILVQNGLIHKEKHLRRKRILTDISEHLLSRDFEKCERLLYFSSHQAHRAGNAVFYECAEQLFLRSKIVKQKPNAHTDLRSNILNLCRRISLFDEQVEACAQDFIPSLFFLIVSCSQITAFFLTNVNIEHMFIELLFNIIDAIVFFVNNDY
jgi:hypothetical protein